MISALRAYVLTAMLALAAMVAASLPAGACSARSRPRSAWVANYGSATVTPVNLASRQAGKAIPVGADPAAVAVTPDGRTVYVANEGSGTVTPIDTPPAGRGGR